MKTCIGTFTARYMWFREDGPVTREDYAEIVTTLMLEGVKAIR